MVGTLLARCALKVCVPAPTTTTDDDAALACSREESGTIFWVGVFLDFASSSTRTMHPHVALGKCRWAGDVELTPMGAKSNGTRRVPRPLADPCSC